MVRERIARIGALKEKLPFDAVSLPFNFAFRLENCWVQAHAAFC